MARGRVCGRPRAVRRTGPASRRAAVVARRVAEPAQRSFRDDLRPRVGGHDPGVGTARDGALARGGRARSGWGLAARDGALARGGQARPGWRSALRARTAAEARGRREELHRGDGQRPGRAHALVAAGRRAPVLAGQLLEYVRPRPDQDRQVLSRLAVVDRDDPAVGGAGQRLVRRRGRVRVRDRHVRLRVRDQGSRELVLLCLPLTLTLSPEGEREETRLTLALSRVGRGKKPGSPWPSPVRGEGKKTWPLTFFAAS